jgi:hypothetical protein
MNEITPITAEQFSRRLVELCLRSNLPGLTRIFSTPRLTGWISSR